MNKKRLLPEVKNQISWKLFWILLIISILGITALLPHTLILQAGLVKKSPLSLHLLLSLQILQNILIYAFFIFIGLYLGNKVGLGIPILENWLEGKDSRIYFKSILITSIVAGLLICILIISVDFLLSIFIPPLPKTPPLPIWVRFLGCFYAAINEEIIMRLFLMTLLVWIFYKIRKETQPTNLSVWLSIIISAILFGVSHLPFTATLAELTFFVSMRSIILNGSAGVIFGWLYWKKGLESAILSHFVADILLHIVFPYLIT
jgi:membrane protease YdiL (CAAX protease family)